MRLDDGIRKHGFRKWYSRELTLAHLQLVLLLLSTIGVFAAVELVSRPGPAPERLGNGMLLLACLVIGVWSLRRYFFLLMRAEAIARQAVCPGCRVYGRLRLQDPADGGGQVTVSCVRCARRWHICDLGIEP